MTGASPVVPGIPLRALVDLGPCSTSCTSEASRSARPQLSGHGCQTHVLPPSAGHLVSSCRRNIDRPRPRSALPAAERAQLTATGLHIAPGAGALLPGALEPDSGTVQRIGTLGVAEQEREVVGGRTVGDLIDSEPADARAALAVLGASAEGLAAGARRPPNGTSRRWTPRRYWTPGMPTAGSTSPCRTWARSPTCRADRPSSRSGTATGPGSPVCSAPRTASFSWTSPPTAWTPPGSTL